MSENVGRTQKYGREPHGNAGGFLENASCGVVRIDHVEVTRECCDDQGGLCHALADFRRVNREAARHLIVQDLR